MVSLPLLGKVAWDLMATSGSEMEQAYPLCAYLFLCSIFVAMTNQVSHVQLAIEIKITRNLIKWFLTFRFTNGPTRTGVYRNGLCTFRTAI